MSFKQVLHKDVQSAVGKDSDDSVFKTERLGEIRAASYNSGECLFQFCEVMDSKVTSGEVVAYGDSDASSYLVEAAASTSNAIRAAGVVYTTASVGDGVWVQKKGPNLKDVNTDGTVTADTCVVKSSGNAGVLTQGASAEANHGVALQADPGSALTQGELLLDFPLR